MCLASSLTQWVVARLFLCVMPMTYAAKDGTSAKHQGYAQTRDTLSDDLLYWCHPSPAVNVTGDRQHPADKCGQT